MCLYARDVVRGGSALAWENAGPDMTISMNVVSTSSRGGVLPWLLVYVRDAAGQLIRGAG